MLVPKAVNRYKAPRVNTTDRGNRSERSVVGLEEVKFNYKSKE